MCQNLRVLDEGGGGGGGGHSVNESNSCNLLVNIIIMSTFLFYFHSISSWCPMPSIARSPIFKEGSFFMMKTRFEERNWKTTAWSTSIKQFFFFFFVSLHLQSSNSSCTCSGWVDHRRDPAVYKSVRPFNSLKDDFCDKLSSCHHVAWMVCLARFGMNPTVLISPSFLFTILQEWWKRSTNNQHPTSWQQCSRAFARKDFTTLRATLCWCCASTNVSSHTSTNPSSHTLQCEHRCRRCRYITEFTQRQFWSQSRSCRYWEQGQQQKLPRRQRVVWGSEEREGRTG